jgi:hypothetical protein
MTNKTHVLFENSEALQHYLVVRVITWIVVLLFDSRFDSTKKKPRFNFSSIYAIPLKFIYILSSNYLSLISILRFLNLMLETPRTFRKKINKLDYILIFEE